MQLRDTRVLLGVSGGIAAYKAGELVRELKRAGAQVGVAMTPHAREFVAPLTFEALSGHPVITDTFALNEGREMNHIILPEACSAFVIAPATANIIGKLAHGIADDVVTTMALVADGARKPRLLAPAMNSHMYMSSAVQANLDILTGRGYRFVGPGTGDLACGYTGPGRMAEATEIIEALKAVLAPQDLTGRRVVVTAGPTREPFDPVRYISNRSSGKMGYALAGAAARRGAAVVLISGPSHLPLPNGMDITLKIETAAEMEQAVLDNLARADVLIMCAAVADYTPAHTSSKKEPRNAQAKSIAVKLEQTADIAAYVGALKQRPLLVGFAAETHEVIAKAGAKLRRKHLDMIVANQVGVPDSGFEVDTNQAAILEATGVTEELPVMPKEELAEVVLTHIVRKLDERSGRRRAPRPKARTKK